MNHFESLYELLSEKWQTEPLNLFIPALLPLFLLILVMSVRQYWLHKITPKWVYLLTFITIIGNCIYCNIFTLSLIESPYKIVWFFSMVSTICFCLIFGTLYIIFIILKLLLSQIE